MSRFRALSRIYGILSPPIQSRIANDIDDMVSELLDAAAELWATTGYKRFNNHEANCTIQLYRWSDEIARTRARLRVLTVQLEWVQPTPEMLAGEEDAERSSRPDLRVATGRVAYLILECKRLSLGNALPRRYVTEGMARFVIGDYAADQERGGMVGYIQAGDPTGIVAAINRVVVVHPGMGETHRLYDVPPLPTIQLRYDSNHTRVDLPAIQLKHFLIDLRQS